MNEEKKRKVILEKRNAEKIIQKRNVLLTLRNGSPSLPSMRGSLLPSSLLPSTSYRSDSEPNISINGYSRTRKPSICITRASVEREDDRSRSIRLESRLPSNLSLGSNNLGSRSHCELSGPGSSKPSTAYLNPFLNPEQRSITPILFPQHQIHRSRSELISICGSRRGSVVQESQDLNKPIVHRSTVDVSRSRSNSLKGSKSRGVGASTANGPREIRLLTEVLFSWTGKRGSKVTQV